MRKFFYDSWVAKAFLGSGYSTVTIGPWVFTRYTKERMKQSIKNHESVHTRQWSECLVASGLVIWLLMLTLNISAWWLIIAPLAMYIVYVLEWLVKLCIFGRKAYKHLSFELEARVAEEDSDYFENSDYFAWIKYLGK